MSQRKIENRNQFVDMMRGIAILLVVLGHTMAVCTVNSQESFIFNIIWSLQMPLFFLISGYVTKYSHSISDCNTLYKYIKRRTLAYMLPWVVWSFLVRGIIFGEKNFLDFEYLLWNMDSGYWFLATIWTINIIFGIANFFAERFCADKIIKKQILLFVCYFAGMVLLIGIGTILGFTFFAIKLTLYYMPFYYTGFLYGQFDDIIMKKKNSKVYIDCLVSVCLGFWLYVILRYHLYELSDSGFDIIFRASTSLAGCIAIIGLCKTSLCVCGGVELIGRNTLEIYLIHYLFLGLIKMDNPPSFFTTAGVNLTLVNYVTTIILSMMVIKLIDSNKILKIVLSGKRR